MENLTKRFLNYISFDTKSDPEKGEIQKPSTIGQLTLAKQLKKELEEFGQRDIQILGLGVNGHIAFNEPAKKLNKYASIVELDKSTIEANSRFFENEDEVPKHALSMGLAEIFDARMIIVLANGKNKHEAVKRLLNDDKISTDLPCGLLNLHPNVYLFVDEEAYNG